MAKGKYHFEIVAKPGSEEFWSKLGFYQTGVSEKTVKHPKTGELVHPLEMRYDFGLGDLIPQTIKEVVKLALTPLLASLTLLQFADIDSESEMLGYGIGVILLNVGIYFAIPAAYIMKIRKLQ